MTDFEFSKIMCTQLLYSDENCCSMCVLNPADEDRLFENLANHDVPDDNICYEGIRAYFERFEEAHA